MKIASFLRLLLVSFLFFFLNACKKGPGEGGRASISGSVFAYNYSNSFVLTDSSFIGGQKVYIQYGNEVGVSSDADTDDQGRFSFPYMREGDYKVWVYSKQLANNTLDKVVLKSVSITSRKQQIDLPRFEINTLKN